MADWIASGSELDARLDRLDASPIALDTEFIREKTFYPQLALVQLAQRDDLLLIDPLGISDMMPMRRLLESPALKLMHSPSEDLQTFRHACNALPRPLFDTQVAAALCGMGQGLGYQALIEKLLGVRLEKGETRSDWMRRPLSDSQLVYAADDVRHLAAAHAQLDLRLRELGRRDWLDEECARQLAAAESDDVDANPHLAMRSAQRLRPEQQARLRLMLQWRDRQARRSDKPKSWVLDNELVIELAQREFNGRSDFESLLDARPRAPRRARDVLWDVVAQALAPEDLDIPLLESADPRWREPLRRMQESVAAIAAALELPEGLLCARRHLESLIATREWPRALDGWRRPLLEPKLRPILG
jgi:ribonuclease D